MLTKLNNSLYIVVGVILLICIITIWNISPSNDNDGRLEEILREMHQIKMLQLQTHSSKIVIEKRLEEANENWKRGLEARKKLEAKNLIDPSDAWNFRGSISIWDFFYPNFDCPHTVERIGKSGDGGKWICGFSHLAKKLDQCVVYSYGVSLDSSFEAEVVSRTNCFVYMFDHTIDTTKVKLPKLYPDRVFIEKLGLGVNDTSTLRSILSTMKMYGHKFVDILKVDVEGAEFSAFDNFKNDFPEVLPFGQIAVEIHLPDQMNIVSFEKHKSWLTNLEDMGLRAFRNEFNLISAAKSYTHNLNLCEFSFINVKNLNNYLLHD